MKIRHFLKSDGTTITEKDMLWINVCYDEESKSNLKTIKEEECRLWAWKHSPYQSQYIGPAKYIGTIVDNEFIFRIPNRFILVDGVSKITELKVIS
jgi:hypothetical protein